MEGGTLFKGLETEDNTKFSLSILIAVRLEYEYGAQSDVRKGFYEGRFQVKELQSEDTPFILDRRDDLNDGQK